MKARVTITLEPAILLQAKTVAEARHTNLSSLIEGLLEQTVRRTVPGRTKFSKNWAGKFTVRNDKDELLEAMKARHGLSSK